MLNRPRHIFISIFHHFPLNMCWVGQQRKSPCTNYSTLVALQQYARYALNVGQGSGVKHCKMVLLITYCIYRVCVYNLSPVPHGQGDVTGFSSLPPLIPVSQQLHASGYAIPCLLPTASPSFTLSQTPSFSLTLSLYQFTVWERRTFSSRSRKCVSHQ